jgi:restriction system-associated AAA family ATPase
MHSIGLALLYKNTSSLFLLDEPETHLNPDWRAKYISTLRDCFKDDEVSPEVLITSHSPFIVSDSKQENVLVFEKDDESIVECHRPDFNTFGASVNKITRGVFDRRKTIGDYASEIIDDFKREMETTDDMEGLFERLDETIGDSIEKTLFMKELFDRIEKR